MSPQSTQIKISQGLILKEMQDRDGFVMPKDEWFFLKNKILNIETKINKYIIIATTCFGITASAIVALIVQLFTDKKITTLSLVLKFSSNSFLES